MADKHLKEQHSNSGLTEKTKTYEKRLCAICDEKFRSFRELKKHFKESHEDIQLKHEEHVFNTDEGFERWKKEEEIKTKSAFVKNGGVKKLTNKQFTYYICNRSGTAKIKSERKRHVKMRESVKCGKTCPAFMKCTREQKEEAIKITVEYQSVHAGHDLQVLKHKLNQEDKNNLIFLLEIGVTPTKIIEYFKGKCLPTERLGLLTKKDLHNMKQNLKLDKTALNSNDREEKIKCIDSNLHTLNATSEKNSKERMIQNDNLQILTSSKNMTNTVKRTEHNDDKLKILTCTRNMTNIVERTNIIMMIWK
ncbi:putative zinc finger transcription factor protein 17 [Trichonephila inaurata madagascariensis]|uniref:Putative zinc finger transcription factor protein 17 n=1 Tax=Trichonephila inaurata madagascariensis TaxID=2747483 RepID=A0A8X7BQP1_9ARAC|nr:putative zinc finger transcription factor protein 17 [Trichonephila inaurata madagascariensis]